MSICKLCQTEKSLVSKSHIIPDSMYKQLYDKKHKIHKFAPSELLKEKPIIQKPSSGIYEGGLLCADCDNRVIGGYETYGVRMIYASAEENPLPSELAITVKHFQNLEGQRFDVVHNVDYTKFKLFLLSILWRASISTKGEFAEVNLGPKHTENIRRMIYEGDAGDLTDYPIRFQTYVADDTPTDIIVPPRRTRVNGNIAYVFTITGFFYIFQITSGQRVDAETAEHTLRPEGTFTVLHVDKGSAMGHLFKLLDLNPPVRRKSSAG